MTSRFGLRASGDQFIFHREAGNDIVQPSAASALIDDHTDSGKAVSDG